MDRLPRARGEGGVWGKTLQLDFFATDFQIGNGIMGRPPFREETALRPCAGLFPLVQRPDSPGFGAVGDARGVWRLRGPPIPH
eukprot:7094937-Prorocentrum_lima.AAC.1